jgi:pimeloyl-ACP methyl ester carboxylesterase
MSGVRPAVTRLVALSLSALVACHGPSQPGPSPNAAASSGLAVVNGTTLYYETRGKGPAVVLLEGGNLDCRMWDDQWEHLAPGFRLIRYDVRGFGRSGHTGSPYSAHEDLYGLLRYLRVERASLVGLSLGGRIAIDFALEHPAMVQALVLAGPGLSGWSWSSGDSAWFARIDSAAAARDSVRAAELWLKTSYMVPAMENPELAPQLHQLAIGNAHFWLEPYSERELKPPAIGRLGELRAPTLLILGSRDVPDIHRIVDTLARSLPSAKRVLFPGSGHMVNLEQPERFNRVVLQFLQERGR